ncbi:hypothetical protein BE17_07815 [Sorangium cellulosum]|uniref:Protein kinase domain-containing protein n=1 Tax=Sorangium cellulosum TaxID=56 RepID=A0A150R5J1_SORCE|nr:hypothetical protein BE17_07815 [Sorangium cellulosum]
MQIVHRDLKPANVFLHRPPEASDFVVKVLDFGVAKNLTDARGASSTMDAAVGSPFYMSPEQVRADGDVDARADLWALGVVLFEMLTGVRPFQGEGPQLLSQILSGEIPKVSRYLRRVDERLVRIVDRCLRRERGERFASAEEVAGELAAFVVRGVGAGEAGAARGESAAEAEWRELRITGERAAPPPRSVAEQETAVAPPRGQGSGSSAEELATTVPVGRPEPGNGGRKTAAGQGLAAASAVSGWGGSSASGVSSVGGPVAGRPVGGASSTGAPTGAPVAGVPSEVLSTAAPTGAPVAGARPVVTLRGTFVMQGQAAEAQRQAAMAMMDAARAQALAQRAGAHGAIAQASSGVGTRGEARRGAGGARAVAVAVTLAVVVLVGVLATAWFVGREKPPATPAGADGGSVPATGTMPATQRDVERAAATGTPGAVPVPERPAVTGAPAAVEPGERGGVKAAETEQAPQAGARSPAPATTAGQASLPSHAAGTAATPGGRAQPSGGGAGPGKKPSLDESVYEGTAATTGGRAQQTGGVSGPGKKPSLDESVYEAPQRSTAPAARGVSPVETTAPEKKRPAPARPF